MGVHTVFNRDGAVVMEGSRDNWATSAELFAVIRDIWRPRLDVCASADNAKCDNWIGAEGAGALGAGVRWYAEGGYYFCNPPGSQVAAFVEKALIEQELGSRGVMIFQAGISSAWFGALSRRATIYALTPRPNFVVPPGVKTVGDKSANDRDWMLAVIEPWFVSLPPGGGRELQFDWEETGVMRGVLARVSAARRCVLASSVSWGADIDAAPRALRDVARLLSSLLRDQVGSLVRVGAAVHEVAQALEQPVQSPGRATLRRADFLVGTVAVLLRLGRPTQKALEASIGKWAVAEGVSGVVVVTDRVCAPWGAVFAAPYVLVAVAGEGE